MPPADLDRTETVKLGSSTYDLVPQPAPYLRSKLGATLSQLSEADVDQGNLLDVIFGKSYEVLVVFIPSLMPRHVWDGYRTAEDQAEDNLADEAWLREHSPTVPEIQLALKVGCMVNGIDLWKQLKGFVDPTMLRSLIQRLLAGDDTSSLLSSPSSSSPSTPPSPSETSSTIDAPTSTPTDPPTADSASPSPESTPSSSSDIGAMQSAGALS